MSDAELPRYTRQVPDEWSELSQAAGAILAEAGDTLTVGAADVLLDEARCLDNESLEANYYYAVGVAACYFAREMAQPARRSALVQSSAQDIYNRRTMRSQQPDTLLVSDLARIKMAEAPKAATTAALRNASPSERFLLDTIGVATMERRYNTKSLMAHIRGNDAARVVRGDFMAQLVGTDSFTGSMTLHRTVLKAIVGQPSVARFSPKNCRPEVALRDALAQRDIAELQLRRPARFAASLHVREFLDCDLRRSLFDATTSSEVRIYPELLGDQPPAPGVDTIGAALHNKRLRCPALHVKGLIDLTVAMTGEIITEAARLEAQAAV